MLNSITKGSKDARGKNLCSVVDTLKLYHHILGSGCPFDIFTTNNGEACMHTRGLGTFLSDMHNKTHKRRLARFPQ